MTEEIKPVEGLLLTDDEIKKLTAHWQGAPVDRLGISRVDIEDKLFKIVAQAQLAHCQPIIEAHKGEECDKRVREEREKQLRECLRDLVSADGAEDLKLLEKNITELIYQWKQALKSKALKEN
jgi:hypothetical protein